MNRSRSLIMNNGVFFSPISFTTSCGRASGHRDNTIGTREANVERCRHISPRYRFVCKSLVVLCIMVGPGAFISKSYLSLVVVS